MAQKLREELSYKVRLLKAARLKDDTYAVKILKEQIDVLEYQLEYAEIYEL